MLRKNFPSFFFFLTYMYMYLFWLCWVSIAAWGFLQLQPAGYSLVGMHPLIVVASLVVEHRLLGVRAQELGHTGLVVPWQVASSWTRDRTHVPGIGRWILNHWTTREVQISLVFKCSISLWKNCSGEKGARGKREKKNYAITSKPQ